MVVRPMMTNSPTPMIARVVPLSRLVPLVVALRCMAASVARARRCGAEVFLLSHRRDRIAEVRPERSLEGN